MLRTSVAAFLPILFVAAVSAQVPPDREMLLKGEGSPLLKNIEAYGYPDPARVVQFATTLNISSAQKTILEQIAADMKTRAKELGQQIVRVESELDEAFKSGMVGDRSVRDDAEQIGRMRGRLRAVYLTGFLSARRVLTSAQLDLYKKLIAAPEKKTTK